MTYFNFIKGTERESEEKDYTRQIEIKSERERKEIVKDSMKNTYCLFQVKFITEYTTVQHIIITQI